MKRTAGSPLALALVILIRLLLGMVVATPAVRGAADPEPVVLTRVRDIRRLTPDMAALGLPVRLEAVISFMDPDTTVFVQDQEGGAGTFFRDLPRDPGWRRGQRVLITGETFPGLYVPGIRAARVETLGTGKRPAPIRVTVDDLESGRFHYQWVEIEGIGRALETTGEGASVLRLAVGSRMLEVRLDEVPPADLVLVDARLRVRGLAAGVINNRRQLVSPYLKAGNYREITVIDPAADPHKLTPVSIAELLRFAPNGATDRRLKVRGVVISHRPGERIFLREGEASLLVESEQTEPLQAGDQVEAIGFPRMGTFCAQLEDAVYRRTGTGPPPPPRRLSAKELLTGQGDADLVTLDGVLVAHINSPEGEALALQSDGIVFRVHSPRGPLPAWPTGSQLSATGICRIAGSTAKGYNLKPASFELRARSPNDLHLLSAPSWWTARRLAWGLGLFVVATAGAGVWIFVLLRRLGAQRAVIQVQRERQAVSEERRRIAREVHDSLEQELVGLSLRLDTVAAVAGDGADPKVLVMLEAIRRLVVRIQAEIRHLIWDLRDQDDGPRDLGRHLQRLIRQWEQTSPAQVRVEVAGAPWPLPSLAEHNLLRVAQEALTNALKHAQPQTVVIEIGYEPDRLCLRIRDDGRGFETQGPGAAPPGHFGLVGMRERTRKLGAPLQISSAPGQGTTIEVVVPRPPESTS